MSMTADDVSNDDTVLRYETYSRHKALVLAASLLIVIALAVADLCIGRYSTNALDVVKVILNHILDPLAGNIWDIDGITDDVIWRQRLPRILVALIAGAGLAVSGAAMQSMLKNPLADPYTTGISSGAAFGATLSITMGICLIPGDGGTVINAFIFGLVPAAIVLALSRLRRPSPTMMVLAGISLMYVFNSLQQYLMLSADPNSSQQVLSWTIGSITSCTWDEIPLMLAIVVACSLCIQYMTRTLNAMNSGDAYARSLGVDVDSTRVLCLMVISLMSAGIVSFTGIIGFVGLVAPHIARIFIGSDNRVLVPASAIAGAGLLLFADIVTHYISSFDLPIGIVTAVIGGPLFIYLMLRQRKEVWRCRRYQSGIYA